MPGQRLKAASFIPTFTGERADIRLSETEREMYLEAIEKNDEISIRRRTHLNRYFKEFCDNDDFHKRLNDKQFKREGKFKDGNGQGGYATIWTFKAWQWRLYGAILTVEGRRCFVGVRVDPNKKQDKADPKILRAAAELIGALHEYET